MLPREDLAISGDIFGGHNWDCAAGIQWVEVRDGAKHSAVPWTAPHLPATKNYPPTMSIVHSLSILPRCLSVDPFLLCVSVSLQAQSQNLDLMPRGKNTLCFSKLRLTILGSFWSVCLENA